MRTERGFERLINFSDATIAIAMTLLVLPLVELGGESEPGQTLGDLLYEHNGEILSFALSFMVIWIMWLAHHRIIEMFRGYDQVMLTLHMVWLFTMVSIPFTTQLLNNGDFYLNGAVAVYVAVLFVSSASLHAMSIRGRRRPALLHTDREEVQQWLRAPMGWSTLAVLVVVFVVVLVAPQVGAWPLLLLIVDEPLERLVRKVAHRQPTSA